MTGFQFSAEAMFSATTPTSEERAQKVRQEANRYVERHGIRELMQGLFQRLVKERPDDPRAFLKDVLASQDGRATRMEALEALAAERECDAASLRERLAQAESAAEAARGGQEAAEAEARRSLAELRASEAEARRAAAALGESALSSGWERQYKVELAKERGLISELQKQVQELNNAASQEAITDKRAELERQLASEQTKVKVLGLRVQELESAVRAPGKQALPALGQETAVKTAAFPWQDAHLLSQYFSPPCAQPVPPAAVPDGPTEHSDGDIAETHSEVIVEVTGCQDAMTNGTYVWIGVSNLRPVYRLLGPEPRYLHYTEVSVASGWQIVSKMGGAQEPVERFRGSLDDSLPVHCKAGDLGSRVVDTGLSAQVAGRISMISCGEERTTIRSKLAAVFGRYFTQLEAQHRVLASGSPAVVSVACTLEAQQRAVRRIGGQLAAEVQRREAAEAQLRCAEEAFETLQLRMQAQLPQRPACAALVAAPPAGAPPLPRRRPASPGGAALGGGGAAAGPAGGAPAAGVAG